MQNGMKRINEALETLMGPRMYTLKVIEIQILNSNIKKIRFIGDLSKLNFQKAYAMNIHLGAIQSKSYTTSFLDVENGILEVIFHLHGTTLESLFVDSLKIGDEIRVSMSRSQILYDQDSSRYFIFGDETSLGLACSFLPLFKINKQKYHYYFELNHENYKIPLSLGLENYSIYPKDGSFTN